MYSWKLAGRKKNGAATGSSPFIEIKQASNLHTGADFCLRNLWEIMELKICSSILIENTLFLPENLLADKRSRVDFGGLAQTIQVFVQIEC